MTFAVKVEPAAERDWDEAVGWYGGHEPELGHRLNAAIRAVLHTLARQPERFPLATRLTRKAKVPRPWHYSIYFTINTAQREIIVLAIWHGARDPDELRRRLK